MPPQAEARAWWADVQHLRPDAEGHVAAPPVAPSFIEDESGDELARRRRGRITGRELQDTGEIHLNRADAAAFGDALSLESEFGLDDRHSHDEDDRRTVHITGRPEPAPVRRLYEVEPRRARETPLDRLGARPDRIAMWAVALGIFLVLLAAVSSSADAATLVIR